MKYLKIYKLAKKELWKLNKQEDRVNNHFILICMLIYDFSQGGKYLKETLKMINEFDYDKNFKGDE